MRKTNLVLTVAAIASCANTMSKKVENDIAQQTVITNRQAMMSGLEAIGRSKNLTPEQKESIVALMDQTRIKMGAIRRQEAQGKASFFKYVATGEYDERRMNAYRKQLLDVEKQKVEIMISNLKELRKILGRKPVDDKEIPELMNSIESQADLD